MTNKDSKNDAVREEAAEIHRETTLGTLSFYGGRGRERALVKEFTSHRSLRRFLGGSADTAEVDTPESSLTTKHLRSRSTCAAAMSYHTPSRMSTCAALPQNTTGATLPKKDVNVHARRLLSVPPAPAACVAWFTSWAQPPMCTLVLCSSLAAASNVSVGIRDGDQASPWSAMAVNSAVRHVRLACADC